jgi:hypothetical protein
MVKKIVILSLFFFNVYAVQFKELRYLYAVDKHISFEGNITFSPQSIEIKYTKPKAQTIKYRADDEQREKRYFFMLLSAIHNDNKGFLEEFFKVKKKNRFVYLSPLEKTKAYIKKVIYKKEGLDLKSLKIFMQNKDRIEIETLD